MGGVTCAVMAGNCKRLVLDFVIVRGFEVLTSDEHFPYVGFLTGKRWCCRCVRGFVRVLARVPELEEGASLATEGVEVVVVSAMVSRRVRRRRMTVRRLTSDDTEIMN